LQKKQNNLKAAMLVNLLELKNTADFSKYIPLMDMDSRIGWLRPNFAKKLLTYSDVFMQDNGLVFIRSNFSSKQEKSDKINEIIWRLRYHPEFGHWNDEYGEVLDNKGNHSFIIAR
jgi:hypothetical protein